MAFLYIAKPLLPYFLLRLLPLKILKLRFFILFQGLWVQKLLRLYPLKLRSCCLFCPFPLNNHPTIYFFNVLSLSHTIFFVVSLLSIWLIHRIIYMILTSYVYLLRLSNKAVQRWVSLHGTTLIEVNHFVILTIVFLIIKVLIIFWKFLDNNRSFKEIYFSMDDFVFFLGLTDSI